MPLVRRVREERGQGSRHGHQPHAGRGWHGPVHLEPAGAKAVKITRLARGIASGSVLEFANKEMLADALRGRQAF